MRCKSCGVEIQEGAAFCTSCGAAQNAPSVGGNPAVSGSAPKEPSNASRNLGIASLICALVTPIGSCGYCFFGVPGLFLWIASLITGFMSHSKAKQNGQKPSGFATAGIIVSIVVGVIVLICNLAAGAYAGITLLIALSEGA